MTDLAARLLRRRSPRHMPDAMTFVEHLGELRRRIIVSFVAFGVMAVVTYVAYPHVLGFFEHPLCQVQASHHLSCTKLYVTGPLEGFGVRLNLSAYGGLVLASPVLVFELWRFVTPGLRANEKRYAVPFSVASALLFALGAFIAWLTFPHALAFLHAAGGPGITDIFSPAKYLNLILALMGIFGLAFEFPVVLVGLELAGVLSPARLAHWRRPAIIIIVVFCGVATPSSDPFSMLALAVPMLIFYEASILIGRACRR